ncbi:hypothetical protein ACFL5O_04275 [Myxococcota bacterium]
MNEPRRLHEESGSRLERVLLEAGASYRSSAQTRARTLAALGLSSSAALTTSAASSSLFAQVGWVKLAAAVSAIGAATAIPSGYYVWREHRPTPAASVASTALLKTVDRPARLEDPVRQPSVPTEASGKPAAELPSRPSPSGRAALPKRALRASLPVQPKPKADSEATGTALMAELRALDAARSTLARGDPNGALFLLNAYGRDFPLGRLQLEAEVLRIDALAKSGRAGAARRRAQAFLRQRPNSVLASRVRGYLND